MTCSNFLQIKKIFSILFFYIGFFIVFCNAAYEDPLDYYDAVLRQDSINEEFLVKRGKLLLSRKSYHEAKVDFKKVSIEFPSNIFGWEGLAIISFHHNKLEESIHYWNKVIEIEPNNEVYCENKIKVLLKKKEYRRAHDFLDRYSQESLPIQSKLRGLVFLHEGFKKPALEALDSYLRVRKDDKGILLKKAKLLYSLGDFGGCEKTLGMFGNDLYENRQAKNLFLKSLFAQKKYLEFSLSAEKYLNLDEEWVIFNKSLIKSYTEINDYMKAIERIEWQINNEKTPLIWYLKKAELYLKSKDYEKALEAIDYYLLEMPKSQKAILFRSQILIKKRRIKEAISYLSLHAKNQIVSNEIYLTLGRLYLQEKKYEQALSHFLLSHSKETPSDESIFLAESKCLQALGKLEEAVSKLNFYLMIREENVSVRMQRASLLLQLKRYSSALKDYSFLVSKVPENGEIWRAKSICHFRLGEIDQAKSCFKKANLIFKDSVDFDYFFSDFGLGSTF